MGRDKPEGKDYDRDYQERKKKAEEESLKAQRAREERKRRLEEYWNG